MRAKSLILLLLALGCGLVASIGVTQVMGKRGKASPELTETRAIFVALEDIPTGDVITAEAIKLEEWPVDKVPEGAIGRLEDVEGKRPKSRIYAGSPILEQQLGAFGAAAESIPEGYRVIPVKVDMVSGGSGMLNPGDRVDVSVFLERNPMRGFPRTETRLILQDIKVFAINDTWEMDPEGSGQQMRAQTVSLLVTPAQAQKVILANELGKIRLVMRSPGDADEAKVAAVSAEELLGGSDRGDRDADSPSVPFAQLESMEMGSEFLQFLASQQRRGEAVDVAASTPSRLWKMRKIEGDEVTEVVLALDNENERGELRQASGASSGFSFWKLMSAAARSAASQESDESPDEEVEEETEQTDEQSAGEDAEDEDDWARSLPHDVSQRTTGRDGSR